MDDGKDTPLVTGTVLVEEVVECLLNHSENDHGLRVGIIWRPSGNNLVALIMTLFDVSGERTAVKRIAYSKVAA
eukprot:scaffold2911_cov177-Amphora_coffeaeformis.AAC.2